MSRFYRLFAVWTVIAAMCHQTAKADGIELLKITVLEGEGAFNDSKTGTGHNPVVLVEDQNQRPVKGAGVTFILPQTGQGGVFAQNQKSFTTATDAAGRASASGFRPNAIEGSFDIVVKASYEGAMASALIPQSNTRAIASGGGVGRKILWIGLAGAAAAGGILAFGSKGTSTSPAVSVTPPTSISGGAISVGGPR